ncbi:MAG: hypothetical protein QXS02_04140 [Candidatus Thermoplasmatota archaeon]
MDEINRMKVVSCVDMLVGIILICIGFVLFAYGNDWGSFLASLPSYTAGTTNPYLLFDKIPLIISMSGIALLLYGIKRLVDDITRLFVKKSQ